MFKIVNSAKITNVPFIMPTEEDFPDGNTTFTFFKDMRFDNEGLIGIEMRCSTKDKGSTWLQPEYNFFNAEHFIKMYNWHLPTLQTKNDGINSMIMTGYFEYIPS